MIQRLPAGNQLPQTITLFRLEPSPCSTLGVRFPTFHSLISKFQQRVIHRFLLSGEIVEGSALEGGTVAPIWNQW